MFRRATTILVLLLPTTLYAAPPSEYKGGGNWVGHALGRILPFPQLEAWINSIPAWIFWVTFVALLVALNVYVHWWRNRRNAVKPNRDTEYQSEG
jgi:hypothetical protein